MKIESSEIFMQSAYKKTQVYKKEENLQVWNNRDGKREGLNFMSADMLDISSESKALLYQTTSSASSLETQNVEDEFEISDEDRKKIELLERLIEQLTGKKFKFMLPKKIKFNDELSHPQIQRGNSRTEERAGWGLVYTNREIYHEKEELVFSSSGIIKTEDGRSINFDLNFFRSREYLEESNTEIRMGDAVNLKDPLVINYKGELPELSDLKIDFDLDADGSLDKLSFLKEGSGFLALDKNKDGQINDGSELFGPLTNNGFEELSKYDSDKNGWIDENDSVFNELTIWTKDKDGKDVLLGLKEANVGAIYLGNVNSEFSFKDSSQDTQGVIRKTGIFLKEDGQAGVIQHIDLKI